MSMRMSHEKADAYARVRAEVGLELGKYARRMKAAAEAYVDEAIAEAQAEGRQIDERVVSGEALRHAADLYISTPVDVVEIEA